jgi:hypothetical protein
MKIPHLIKIHDTKRSFKKEFRRQIRLAVTAAIGFTIAFAWREAIFNTFLNFVSRILDLAPDHYSAKLYTAITITIFGVLLIFLTSKMLKEKN